MAERVLITGGAGFIGTHLSRHLLDLGFDVRILDNLHPQVHGEEAAVSPWMRTACDVRLADVRDRAAIQSAVDSVDLVIHLASETGTGQSMYAVHRCVDVNVSGTAMLLEALVPHAERVRKLVIASSRAVYGEGKYECRGCGAVYPGARSAGALAAGAWDPVCPKCAGPIEVRPTDEESRTAPASIYGASKLSQELLASAFGAGFGVPVAISALSERLWRRTVVEQSVHWHSHALLLGHSRWACTAGLRGRSREPRLRSCLRCRPRHDGCSLA